jgi:oxygen-dependent protoporphyrinogen oxidase
LVAVEQKYGSLIKGQFLGAKERKKSAEVSKDRAPKFSFPNGLEELIDALDSALAGSILHGRIVQKISREESGVFLASSVEANAARSEYSAVLYAGTAFGLSELQMVPAPGVDVRDFAEIVYPPVASVVLGFRREDVGHLCKGFGMLVPKIEGRNILGTIFSSSLFPDRAPKGCLTLTSYVGGERNPQLARLPAKDLVSTVLSDLRGLLGVRGNPIFEHTCFYPRAIPQYNVGYGKFLKMMNVLEAKAPGFFLAGHFRNGVSLSDSILAGLDVADRIEIYLAQSKRPVPAEFI